MTLLSKCAGTRLFIPKKMKAQHKLSQLLGFEQASLMSHHFGGETISIARAARAKRALRNREIVRRYDAGERVPDIAQDVELTERQIYSILSQGEY
jgi:Mor family transcriptional regulator